MTTREAQAEWQGSLKQGAGRLRLGSGLFEGSYSYPSRFEEASGTNPEELIAAAHAGCYVSRGRAIGPLIGHMEDKGILLINTGTGMLSTAMGSADIDRLSDAMLGALRQL